MLLLMSPLAFILRPSLGGYVVAPMVSQGSSPTPSMATGGMAAVTLAAGLLGVQALRRRQTCREAIKANGPEVPALSRRGASFLALAPVLPALPAHAEEDSIRAAPASLQRVVVDVGNKDQMEKELKFWTKACQMKVLSDGAGADGLRSVTVGYGPEKDDNSFAVEIKEDPSALTRKRPSLLNYSVMQPTVNALNFTQITQPDQIFDMYARVEDSGGTSLVGDASYLDCESPRGVQVRMVPREGPPSVEMVSLNIEVPAFEATKKFYKRIASLEEEAYSQAAVQKFSVLLKSKVGGPKLLLCPVPDQRIKQRDRDEFVGLVMLAPSAKQVADAAEKAIAVALEEEQKKDEEEKEQLRLAGKKPEDLKKGTLARPAVQMVGSDARIDDGVGNIVTFMDNGAFKSSLA